MNKILLFLIELTYILYSGCSNRKFVESNSIMYEAIEKHVAELSSDRYMGRAPMSEAEPLVLDYISG